jgi:hypothetical protein
MPYSQIIGSSWRARMVRLGRNGAVAMVESATARKRVHNPCQVLKAFNGNL